MMYDGFNVTPVGDATIQIQEGKLVVSNVGDSGLDGVLVRKIESSNDNYKITFSKTPDLSIQNSFVKYTTLFKNRLDFPFTLSERIVWYDSNTNKVIMGYNHGLLPQNFSLVGYLNGNAVFDIEVDRDNPPPPVVGLAPAAFWFWFEVVGGFAGMIALALEIYDRLAPTTETLPYYYLDPHDGKCYRIGWLETEDPTPFEVYVNKNVFIVDQVGIKSETDFNPHLPIGSENYFPTSYGTMITAAKIGEFTITSIETIL